MICFYHLDDDGKCAGAMVNQYGKKDQYPSRFFEMNYGYSVPFDQIHKNEIVYIVDFSLEIEQMDAISKITENIIWIDHHKSSIEKYGSYQYNFSGIRSTKYSGCMLTYLYLTNRINWIERDPEDLMKEIEIPTMVKLCDDYDIWRFLNPDTRAFHAGFSIQPHDPEDEIWEPQSALVLANIIEHGKVILKYHAGLMETLIKSYGYETSFEGYKCYVLNQGLISSDDFDSIDVKLYDILIGFIYDGEKYIYSLRSRIKDGGPDVSKIAMKYGGGGHAEASGFISKEFLL